MTVQPVRLHHEGSELNGELFLPDSVGPHAAVIIGHSGLGLLAHERKVAVELTELAYAALAIDMFGGAPNGSPERAGACFASLIGNPELLLSRMTAWFDCLLSRPEINASRIAAIGYCFGGMCVLELARSGAELRAVVSFHGLLSTKAPAQAGTITGSVAAYCAGDDPFCPAGQIDAFRSEMMAAGVDCDITVFDNVAHGFTDPSVDALNRPGIGYDAAADKASWEGMVALLAATLNR
jgi:dienelactone hydrolase